MGVLTKLNKDQINYLIKDSKIQFESIEETISGISDTTYFGISNNEKYVFKVFENSSLENIKNKIQVLKNVNIGNIPQVLSKEVTLYKNKPTALFSFINGKNTKTIKEKHILQLANFLSKLHNTNTDINTKNIYDKESFEAMLLNIKDKSFLKKYKTICDIKFDDKTIIHGDLFPDNVIFENDKLSGVCDFTHICKFDALFDLAVVLISWCFKDFIFDLKLSKTFLEQYNKNCTKKVLLNEMKNHLLYACLFYSLLRYTKKNNKASYEEYLKKFDIIKELI